MYPAFLDFPLKKGKIPGEQGWLNRERVKKMADKCDNLRKFYNKNLYHVQVKT